VAPAASTFHPAAPTTWSETGLRENLAEALILKYVLNMGIATGREIATQLALPFRLLLEQLSVLKESQLLAVRSEAPLGDFGYELTPLGADRARRYAQQSSYFGSFPVPLEQYIASVAAQTTRRQAIGPADVKRAFHDLVLSPELLDSIVWVRH
jgi:hypothetical protein